MPCDFPLTAYWSNEVGASGKRGITFARGASFSGVPMKLPCGQCAGCRLERSRQWAMRCVHEKSLHEYSEFVTLTYDDAHLPEGGTLVKRDLQLFCKRLHNRFLKSRGRGIRFYACGEYGSLNKRPHYHLIVFDYVSPDRKFHGRGKRGETLYTSAFLRELWPYGYNVVGEVTFESCAYVARYIMDKMTGDNAKAHYQVVTSDGVVVDRVPEFTNMSRRPGIGAGWFEKYGKHAYAFDSVIMNGQEVRPPRYYDLKFGEVDSVSMAAIKKRRLRKVVLAETRSDRRRVRAAVRDAKMSLNKRSL